MLAESDKALAVVKDLFGDDPKVWKGPNTRHQQHCYKNVYFDFVSVMLASRTLPWRRTSSETEETWRGENCQWVLYVILQAYQRRGDEVNLVLRPSFLPFSSQKIIYKEQPQCTLIPTQADDVSSF